MGNVIGISPSDNQEAHRASLIDEIVPFDNLSIHEVEIFWRNFYDHASGFAMSKHEFTTMCINVACQLNKSPNQMAHDAGVLFDVLTKESDAKLLDALEFLASIVFICTAPLDDKIDLVYDSWDMSEDNGLQIDEVVISLKSTLLGLAKIIVIEDKPKTTDTLDDDPIRRLAEMAFRDMLKVSPSTPIRSEDTISCDVFHAYCLSNPDVKELFVWSLKHVLQMDPDAVIEKDLVRAADPGDEFMAVKPWEGAIVAPSKVTPLDPSAPVLSLSLHWIYGYNAQDTYARNNVRYTKGGEIVYTAASVGVVLNAKANTQRHLLAHTDDVLSIALHPSKGLAATGETGKTPKLIVWDVTTVKPLVTLRGYHSRGIIQLAFSTIGNELATLGADDDHSVGVYTTRDMWHTAELTWFAKGNKAIPLHVLWHPTDAMQFCCLGVKFIEFWDKQKCTKGIFGKKGKLQPLLCAAWVPLGTVMTLVVGTSDGALYLFQRPELRSTIENAHTASVQTMYVLDKTLVTGGKDGQIKLWVAEKSSLTCLTTFDCNSLLGTAGVVLQSLCLSPDGSTILLGTQTSEIYELSVKEKSMSMALMCGHSVDELWGLATHPTKQEAVTVGDDKWLRVWDLTTTRVLRSVKLECMARAVAYSPDGKLIAVGLGGQVPGKDKANKHPKCGGVVVLVASDLSKAFERNDTKKWIADVKFSPNGSTLAIASHDSSVVLYDMTKQCAKKHAFKKHSSFVSHLDFSADGSYLQSISGAYELLYCDVKTGKQVTSASAFKDEQWATWTCILGWPVQGIWQPESDGSDINAVDRSHSGSLLATADDFGKVKVFRYPCVKKYAGFLDFLGHSSHVTNIRWSAADQFLLSTGGQDRCLFQWKHDIAVKQPVAATVHKSFPSNQATHDSHDSTTTALDNSDVEFEVSGDEFMAVKPWIGAIIPPSVLPMVDNTKPPPTTLTLQHVHGYQGQTALNNVRYMEANRIVYHTAALGVVFDSSSSSQQFFQEHDDDIVGLALHPNRKTVATGQMGKVPKIHVWELGSRGKYVSLACLQGFHKRAVPVLSFSTDGTTLASMGNDDDHSIAIYKWKEGLLTASSKGVRNTLMHLMHVPSTNEWVCLGDKLITFWSEQGRNLNAKKAVLGKTTTPQMFYCAVAIPSAATSKALSKLVVGAHDGSLLVLDDKCVSKVLKAHTGPAYAVFASPTKAEWISGGKDGKVIVWDINLSALHSFDIAGPLTKLFNMSPEVSSKLPSVFAVRSVCFNSDHTRILLGTSGSDVVQFDRMGTKATVVTQGHSQDELWGLAVHPTKPEFCTVGDDMTLRVWSTEHRLQLRMKALDCVARACAYSNGGAPFCIAVGYGGRIGSGKKKHQKEGGLVVFRDADTFDVLYEDKPSKEWISEIKFSPDNSILAVGSHDNAIYLYAVVANAKFTKMKKMFRGHNSYITHLDFSSDSKYIQSNCGAYELLFSDATTGKQVTSARSLRDVKWDSWTCALGWPVQGIWPTCADGTDINAVDRSHSCDLVATGDDFGHVKLFRFPAVAKHSVSYSYSGHSSHVTNVRWLGSDTHVISTGGLDRTIMQWKHERVDAAGNDDSDIKSPLSPFKTTTTKADENDDDDNDSNETSLTGARGNVGSQNDNAPLFDADAGDEFMAVKPWIGAITAPSNPPKENPREPEVTMHLDWVFGYQTELSRNNLRYNANGQIVYHAAAVGIMYDRDTNTQKHHLGHTDDILCMAMSPSGRFVATGERGKKPTIRVWDAKSGATLSVLAGFHSRGVVSVTFSHDEKTIASVGEDDDHSLAIWEDKGGAWSKGQLVTTAKGDKNVNLFAIALPRLIVTGGVKHILFWTLQGKTVSHAKGQFGKLATQQPLLCACSFFDNTTLTGAENGDLYHWTGNTVTKSVKAHDGALSALYSVVADKAYMVVSGGKDGKVCVWNQSLQQTSSFSMDATVTLSSVRAKTIKSVAFDLSLKKILVGTLSSDAFEVDIATGQLAKTIASGHFTGETWGLAVHPLDPTQFLTVGDDKIARLYDRQTKTSVVLMELNDMARAVAFSPDGTMLAIGYGGDMGRGKKKGGMAGAIGFYEHPSTTIVFEDHPSKAPISDVKFNASGTMAAFGSHDTKIYLYSIDSSTPPGVVQKHKVFDAHKSSITHLDFSRDGKYLQSNCGGYELLFCDTATAKQMKSARALRDVVWDSWTCALGWPVQGIWPEFADGTDINSVCVSNSRTFVATGDDSSNVKVFRYPCLTKGAKWIVGQGHCSHVTNVRFTRDDKYIVSTGGNDRATMLWRLSD
ncbi:hypothetical protein, variant [Aphanomyces invadans]|uniref:HELP domain-containing protein n=1 Tax=Aphanomyces invadans TaxID=157072 RepID=A0A024UB51_9STRA|nr:hypothetical protein, variant [Aphanomyces invadans]ETW03494.1 hypothetical protein, variant [Aphanomyces invadans]|eukprot:XP_008867723.1 hypothetical protein, variant [Aphanomyces invadans]